MSEWSIEHAWKSDLSTRVEAHQIVPTQFESTISRSNDVPQSVPVNRSISLRFRGYVTFRHNSVGKLRRRIPTNMAIERPDGTGSAFDDCRLMAPGVFSSADQFETTRKRSLSAAEDASSIIRNRSPSGVTS